MRKIAIELLVIFTIFFPFLAQSASVFKHIGIKEGLGNGFIVDATIDRQGFIWTATEAGVSRISGSFVTEFTKTNSAIGSNEIVCLYYYPNKNRIWIGTKQSGISIYDCNSGDFSHLTTESGLLSMDIADISSASNGGIWILHRNKGIQNYNPTTCTFQNLSTEAYASLASQTRVCVDDGLGHLYVGHFGGGLSIIDLNKKKITRYSHNKQDAHSLPSNYVRAILIDSQQNIWIGTNDGAAMLNPVSKEIKILDKSKMAGDNIHDITETADGKIWFASDLGGITILDWQTNKDKNPDNAIYTQLTVNNSFLSSPNVRKINEDTFGNIWIAHYSTGFDFIPARSESFNIINFKNPNGRYQRVYGLAADNQDNIWLGGENILARYSNGTVQRIWSVNPFQDRKESIIYAIHPDCRGNLWLGINDVGVMVFNPDNEQFKRIDLGHPLDVHAFLEEDDGTIYIGTENSLYSYNNDCISLENKINKKLHSSAIYALKKDGHNRLWVGTLSRGIFIFDSNKNLLHHLNE